MELVGRNKKFWDDRKELVPFHAHAPKGLTDPGRVHRELDHAHVISAVCKDGSRLYGFETRQLLDQFLLTYPLAKAL